MSGMEPILLGLMGAGTLISSYGQYQAGQAQKESYYRNAAMINEEAKYAKEQAKERLGRLMGTQRAMYAKAGVDLASGSPLLLLEETAREGQEEISNIGRTANAQAQLYRFYGHEAAKGGNIGAGSTFLGGMANVGRVGYGSGMFNKRRVQIA